MNCCTFQLDDELDDLENMEIISYSNKYPGYQYKLNLFEPLQFIPYYFDYCCFFDLSQAEDVCQESEFQLENILVENLVEIVQQNFNIPQELSFQVIQVIFPDVTITNFIPIMIYVKFMNIFFNFKTVHQNPQLIFFYFCACFNQNFAFLNEITQFLPKFKYKASGKAIISKSDFMRKYLRYNYDQPQIDPCQNKFKVNTYDKLLIFDDFFENKELEQKIKFIFQDLEEHLDLDFSSDDDSLTQ